MKKDTTYGTQTGISHMTKQNQEAFIHSDKADKRILVVDDEQDICFLIKSILKRETDAEIEVAYSFEQARNKLENKSYQLVFFDVRLGDASGLDLLNYVPNADQVYITMISAYNSSKDLEKMKSPEIDQFLPKPLSRERIISCLDEASL